GPAALRQQQPGARRRRAPPQPPCRRLALVPLDPSRPGVLGPPFAFRFPWFKTLFRGRTAAADLNYRMATETLRTDVELRAITAALAASGGSAPAWLRCELAPAPPPRRIRAADPAAYRGHMAVALSVGGLLAAFLGCV